MRSWLARSLHAVAARLRVGIPGAVLILSLAACTGTPPAAAPTATPIGTPVAWPFVVTRAPVMTLSASAYATRVPVTRLSADRAAPRTRVILQNFTITPSELRARAGQPVRLEILNRGPDLHEFTFDTLEVRVVVIEGTAQDLDFVAPAPGVYVFACNFNGDGDHRAMGMKGTLTVEP
jgi:uncharacterized cupredoxin-like copper-binding protein